MGRRHRIMTSVVGLVAAVSFGLGTAASASAATYPVAPNIVVAGLNALPDPAAPPPGANPASCHSSAHPYPVVLVNGTFANQEDDFGALAPTLANQGYCVYTFAYGAPPQQYVQSVGPIAASAQTLAAYVHRVLVSTGASKVDLVGHSQGGMLAEYYAKVLHGASHVHDLVGLSPSTHGTTLLGLELLAQVIPGANAFMAAGCAACVDQEHGSAALQPLDTGPIAQAGVHYTIIETRNEFVVTPVGSSFIREPGVRNEYVQASCPLDPVDHADLPYDQVVLQLVANVLDPATAHSPDCLHAFPFPA
jgi:triacylglycerol esterase/lipase EstA (alpha/beta hydrolase family)